MRATSCYQQADYQCALSAYDEAYGINPRPLLLFNIAQVYRKLGNVSDAVAFFERFLKEEPETELRAEVKSYLENVRGGTVQTGHSTDSNPPGADNFTGTEQQRAELFQRHVATGVSKFQAGEYEAAITEYWSAYALRPKSILLFNVAQACRKAKRWREAQTLYQRFLKEAPQTPLFGEVEAYLSEIEAQIDAAKLDAERAQAERIAAANARLGETLAQLSVIEHDRRQMRTKAEERKIYQKGWFWGVIGGAVAVSALGIGLGVGLGTRLPTPDFGTRMLEF